MPEGVTIFDKEQKTKIFTNKIYDSLSSILTKRNTEVKNKLEELKIFRKM